MEARDGAPGSFNCHVIGRQQQGLQHCESGYGRGEPEQTARNPTDATDQDPQHRKYEDDGRIHHDVPEEKAGIGEHAAPREEKLDEYRGTNHPGPPNEGLSRG